MKKCFWKGQPFLKVLNMTYASRVWGASRGGSKAAAKSKMERFVIIVYGFQSLTIITKRFILHVAAVLDPCLGSPSRHNIENYGEQSLMNVFNPRNKKKIGYFSSGQ